MIEKGHQPTMSSNSESVTMSSPKLVASSTASIPSMASPITTSASNTTGDTVPSASSTPTTTKKGGKAKGKSEAKKRKVGDDESIDTNEVTQLEKTLDFYRSEYHELLVKLDFMETKAIDQENDYLRIIAKKDEQISTQDELMSKGKDEIILLRASIRELEAEKDEFRQCLMDKEKAYKESKEAEADRQFRAKQKEFGDLLNRYEPSFHFKYRKYYSNPNNSSASSASGSGQKYKIPRNPPTSAEMSCRPGGQCDHIVVSPVGTLTPPASHSWEEAAPTQRATGSRTHTPPTRQLGGYNRSTKLPPYCKKFLKGECNFGASCRFIHVSEGNLFAFLINGIPKSSIHRRETKNHGISESGRLPRSPVFGGSSCQGSQSNSGRQKPQVDVQHHKYLVESCQLKLKLVERLCL